MQGRCSCVHVFSGFPGAHWISPVCPQVAFAGKLCVHLRGTATVNKVKRWRKILDINFEPLQECTCKHTHSNKTPITHRHKQKNFFI